MNMTSKSDSIGVTCTGLRHFADTFSQWNSCWIKLTLGHMTENKCGYQMHIFVTSFSAQHAPAWRWFCMVQPLRQPFRPKCTNRILQMHHQNPVVPPESGVHPQNPVCTYSVTQDKIGTPSLDPTTYYQHWRPPASPAIEQNTMVQSSKEGFWGCIVMTRKIQLFSFLFKFGTLHRNGIIQQCVTTHRPIPWGTQHAWKFSSP